MGTIEDAILRRAFNKFVTLIDVYGVHHKKEHGEWVILEYLPGHVFLLDTWGSVVSQYRFKEGFKPKFSSFCGVKEDNVEYKRHIGANIGSHFTEFNVQISLELLEFFTTVIELCMVPKEKFSVEVGVNAANIYLGILTV